MNNYVMTYKHVLYNDIYKQVIIYLFVKQTDIVEKPIAPTFHQIYCLRA